MKKIYIVTLLILVFLIISVPFLLQDRTNSIYYDFFRNASFAFEIPKSQTDYIPQGLFYHQPTDSFYLSYHHVSKKEPSIIVIVNAKDGSVVKTLPVYVSANEPLFGHVGGIAVTNKSIYLASEGKLHQLSLFEASYKYDNEKIRVKKTFETNTFASFLSYSFGTLWVGDFMLIGEGQVEGYRINTLTDEPEQEASYQMKIPSRIQGITVTKNVIYLSQSYGRKRDSSLLQYEWIGEKELDMTSMEPRRVLMPPLSQGITRKEEDLYILFESIANKYVDSASYVVESVIRYIAE